MKLSNLCAVVAMGVGVAACGGASGGSGTSTPTRQTSEHESEPEYQSGLSQTLEAAPTTYAAGVMTRVYDLGYGTGRLEGLEKRMRDSDEAKEMGCVGISPSLLELAGGGFRGVEACNGMKRQDVASAEFAGPRFAKQRLLVVRKGTETDDPQITSMLLGAYENGYAMGFKRSAEEKEPLKEMHSAVVAGCVRHIAAYAEESPLRAKCIPLADDYLQTYLENLQRIRAARAAGAR